MTIRETSACPFCGQAHSGTACNHALDSLDMEDHGHLINEATEHIDKLNSEITRLTRELAKEQIRYAEMEHKWMKENLDLGMQLAEARKEIGRLKESETITVSVNSMINEGE